MENQRQFKGIWIPKEVWLDKNLNALEKIILMEINSLDDEENGCYASNKYLAEFCQCTEIKVSTTISKLKKLGYIKLENFNGRVRTLKVEILPLKKIKSDLKNFEQINIDNNINNNIEKENIKEKENFEKFYSSYPRKVGKANVEKWFIKNKPNEELMKIILNSLEEHKKLKQWQDKQYIPHPTTWLNQKRWEDDLSKELKISNKDNSERRYNDVSW